MDPAIAMELGIPRPPRIYVECKNREGILDESFWRYLASGSPATIGEWIEDTYEKARKLGAMPYLILKGRGTEPFVFALSTHNFPEASKPVGIWSGHLPIYVGENPASAYHTTCFPISRLKAAYSGAGDAVLQELKG
jgi:hypothetical protein